MLIVFKLPIYYPHFVSAFSSVRKIWHRVTLVGKPTPSTRSLAHISIIDELGTTLARTVSLTA